MGLLPALLVAVTVAVAGLAGCDGGSVSAGPGKIPITTDSWKARRAYLQGVDLRDKQRRSEAREHFLVAIAEDELTNMDGGSGSYATSLAAENS